MTSPFAAIQCPSLQISKGNAFACLHLKSEILFGIQRVFVLTWSGCSFMFTSEDMQELHLHLYFNMYAFLKNGNVQAAVCIFKGKGKLGSI